mmetsp:Transcript_45407/g.110418  ORF Transcript_45407/g.110418 Transcript_45407/m.110418 type:complete len:313 (+) Transcript_45407:106-1044(+)
MPKATLIPKPTRDRFYTTPYPPIVKIHCRKVKLHGTEPMSTKVRIGSNEVTLDEIIVNRVVEFAGVNATSLAKLRFVDKNFQRAVDKNLLVVRSQKLDGEFDQSRDTLEVKDGCITQSLAVLGDSQKGERITLKGLFPNILIRNGHARVEIRSPVYGKRLDYLAFYEALFDAGLFEKKPIPPPEGAIIPNSVSRILKLLDILKRFPLVETEYKKDWMDSNRPPFVRYIISLMIKHYVLPFPHPVDPLEHFKICSADSRKYVSHDVYNQYRGAIPSNLFSPWIDNSTADATLASQLTLELEFLVAAENRLWKW